MRKLAKLVSLAAAAVMAFGVASADIDIVAVEKSDPMSISDVNINADGQKLNIDVTACESITINFDDFAGKEGTYGGGGVGYNVPKADGSEGTDWEQVNWSNDGDLEITVEVAKIAADEKGKKFVQVQCWWDAKGDVPDVDNMFYYTTVAAAAADDKEDAKEDDKKEDSKEDDKKDPAAPTGDATSVIALGAIAVLALAGVAFTKKNA